MLSAPVFGDRTYTVLKFLAQIAFPAFGTLYYTLAQIWGLPEADKVSGTVLAIDTFLGVLLGLSTANYNKSEKRFDGHIDVEETADKKMVSINVKNDDPEAFLEKKDTVVLKVNKPTKEVAKKAVRKAHRNPRGE